MAKGIDISCRVVENFVKEITHGRISIRLNSSQQLAKLLILILNYSTKLLRANPRLLCHGESCDYMLSSFKHGNKNKIQKIHLLIIMKTPLLYNLKQTS